MCFCAKNGDQVSACYLALDPCMDPYGLRRLVCPVPLQYEVLCHPLFGKVCRVVAGGEPVNVQLTQCLAVSAALDEVCYKSVDARC